MSTLCASHSLGSLTQLGFNATDSQDTGFANGMIQDAQELGDSGKAASNGKPFAPDWTPAFKKGDIDGVILVAGDSQEGVKKTLEAVVSKFHDTIDSVITISGHTRPGKEDGHEHFGFEDGISNPAVDGITKDLSTQGPVDQG